MTIHIYGNTGTNIELNSNSIITVAGELNVNAKIGVTLESTIGKVAVGETGYTISATDFAKFTSDNTKLILTKLNNTISLAYETLANPTTAVDTNNGWYATAPTVTANSGYTICDTADGTYGSSLTLNGTVDATDSNKYTQVVYVKDSSGKYYETTLTYNIDTVAPEVAVTTPTASGKELTYSFGNNSTNNSGVTYTIEGLTAQDDGSFKITKAGTYTVTATSGAGKTDTETFTIYSVTYDDNTVELVPSTVVTSKPTAPTKDGYEFAKWVDGDGTEFTFGSVITGNLELSKVFTLKAPAVEVTASSTTAVYGTDITLTATPTHDADVSYTYQWYKDDVAVTGATGSTLTISNVADTGSYNAEVTATENTAINGGTAQTATAKDDTACAVEITTKEVVIDWADDTYTYDGTAQTLPTAKYVDNDGNDVALTVSIDEYKNIAQTVVATSEFKNAGTYTLKATFAGSEATDGNYVLPTTTTEDYSMAQKELTISAVAQTVVYGEKLADCTYTSKGLDGDDTVTAGSYDITYTAGTTGVNDTKATITPKGFVNDNYTITYESAEVTVTARPITIELDDKTSVFGNAKEELTFTCTSDNKIIGTDSVVDITAVTDVNVGTYTITAVANNDNYDVTIVDGEYEITKRALSDSYITIPNETLTYNGGEIKPTPSYADGEVAITTSDYTVSYANNTNAGEDTASVTITATDNGNYSGSAIKNFTIAKKTATVKVPTGTTKVYGEANPSVTLTLDGFVTADGISFEYVIDADETTAVGTHDITITTQTLDNYDVTYTNGTMEITGKALADSMIADIANVDWTKDGFVPEVSISDILSGETDVELIKATDYTIAWEYKDLSKNAEYVAFTDETFVNAGSYKMTVTATTDGNYTGSATTEFSIEDKSVPEITLAKAEDVNKNDVNDVEGDNNLFTTWQGETTLGFDLTDNSGYVDVVVKINGKTVADVKDNTDSTTNDYISSIEDGVNFEYKFDTTGTYEVEIIVTDNMGKVTTQKVTIKVETEIDEFNKLYDAYVESKENSDLTAVDNYYNSLSNTKKDRITNNNSNSEEKNNCENMVEAIDTAKLGMIEDAIDTAVTDKTSETFNTAITVFESYAENGVVEGLSGEYASQYKEIVAVSAVADMYEYTPTTNTRLNKLVSSYEALTETQKELAGGYSITIDGETKTIAEWYDSYADSKTAIDKFTTEVNKTTVKADNYDYIKKLVDYTYADTDADSTLTDIEKSLISVATEEKLESLRGVIAKLDNVETLIGDIEDSVTEANYTTYVGKLIEAQTAYNKLTSTEKAIVGNTELTTAQKALDAYLAQVAADKVEADNLDKAIEFQKEYTKVDVKTSTVKDVEEVISNYDKLTDDVKAKLPDEVKTAVETTYPGLLAEIENKKVTVNSKEVDIVTALDEIKKNGVAEYAKTELEGVQGGYTGLTADAKEILENSHKDVMDNIDDVITRLNAVEATIGNLVDSSSIGDGTSPYTIEDFCFSLGTSGSSTISQELIEEARMALETLSKEEKALLKEISFETPDAVKNVVDSFISIGENGEYGSTYATTEEVVKAMKDLGYTVVTTGEGSAMTINSITMSAVEYIESQYQGLKDYLAYADWTINNIANVSDDENDDEYVSVYGLATKVDTTSVGDLESATSINLYVDAKKLKDQTFTEVAEREKELVSYDIKLYAQVTVDGNENEPEQVQPTAGEEVVVTIPLSKLDSTRYLQSTTRKTTV